MSRARQRGLVLAVLRHPEQFAAMEVANQELLLRRLRKSGLLGRLAVQLEGSSSWEALPPGIRRWLISARVEADRDMRMLRWEVNRIMRALRGTGVCVTLLKGAAYALREIPISQGRLVADVDILVARDDLPLVEKRLGEHGWRHVKLHPHDQRYYREWMHELPPMRHWDRRSEVDVHFDILPQLGRIRPDSALLLADAQPLVVGDDGLKTLAPVDMFLHAVAQLFFDGAFEKGMRDLSDLEGLARHFESDPTFWDQLLPRARRLNLQRPLYYALAHLARLMGVSIPEQALRQARREGPPWPARWLMNRLIDLVLAPAAVERRDLVAEAAWWPLYIRSHWVRMPARLLMTHLGHKWARRWRTDLTEAGDGLEEWPGGG